MERRNFIKNLAAFAVISQIDITEAKESKEVIYDLVLKSGECEIKMKLLSVSTTEKSDTIYFEAIINHCYQVKPLNKMQIIYNPDPNTTLLSEGYVIDWELNCNVVKFSFRVFKRCPH